MWHDLVSHRIYSDMLSSAPKLPANVAQHQLQVNIILSRWPSLLNCQCMHHATVTFTPLNGDEYWSDQGKEKVKRRRKVVENVNISLLPVLPVHL